MNKAIEEIILRLKSGAEVVIDTRKLKPGDIFFALKGGNVDGNDFALDALEKGAALAVVDKKELPSTNGILKVDNVLEILQESARYYRSLFDIPFFGITGSNGKTTTKELINIVLSKKYNVLCTDGNFNNHIGVPLTLFRLKPYHEFAVIEMGANKLGDIELLAWLADPDFGLITNVGKAHLEGFGSFENVIYGKTELYRHLKAKNGVVFINSDNSYLMPHTEGLKKVEYSIESNSTTRGEILGLDPFLRLNVELAGGQDNLSDHLNINTKLAGAYNLENVLSAIAVGRWFGVSNKMVTDAVESYYPGNIRSQIKNTGNNILILDAYNANPTSMKAAIENLAGMKKELPPAIILGDMLELGETTYDEHLGIVEMLRNMNFEKVILVGPVFSNIGKLIIGSHVFPNVEKAAIWFEKNRLTGLTILLKASRGIGVDKLEKFL